MTDVIRTSPLEYSSISNTLGPVATLKLKKSLTSVSTNSELNQLLDDTTIKRGCCMRKKNGDPVIVKVKIPRPKNHPIEVKDSVDDRFNYIEKSVQIDDKLCDTTYSAYTNGSSRCDDFYQSYCSNLRDDYQSMSGTYVSGDWNSYAPECACYGQTTDEMGVGASSLRGLNIPPKCYMPQCGSSASYIDRVSRENQCELTVCNALFNKIGRAHV